MDRTCIYYMTQQNATQNANQCELGCGQCAVEQVTRASYWTECCRGTGAAGAPSRWLGSPAAKRASDPRTAADAATSCTRAQNRIAAPIERV